jgi:Ca2+/H+ antiporter
MNTSSLRRTLKYGSFVFGISSIFLLVLPNLFLELLGLDKSDSLVWSMRMIGITVFALAGNMWNNAGQSSDARVENVAKVMCLSAASLGVLTLMIPVKLTWFSYIYAAIGFSFAISYAFNLMRSSK